MNEELQESEKDAVEREKSLLNRKKLKLLGRQNTKLIESGK